MRWTLLPLIVQLPDAAKLTARPDDAVPLTLKSGSPHVLSASAPKLMESGKPYLFTIDLWATSNVFLPGHRIRLEISSSNFPRFDRNLNTGEPFGEGTRGVPAQQTAFHQDDMASYLLLPVIPR